MNRTELGRMLIYIDALRRTSIWKIAGDYVPHRGQMRVLRCILEHPGYGQKDIAESMSISPASVADCCRRLEEEGLIERRVDSENRRCKVLEITRKGRDVFASMQQVFAQVDDLCFKNVTPDEYETLKSILSKMIENLGGKDTTPQEVFAGLREREQKQ